MYAVPTGSSSLSDGYMLSFSNPHTSKPSYTNGAWIIPKDDTRFFVTMPATHTLYVIYTEYAPQPELYDISLDVSVANAYYIPASGNPSVERAPISLINHIVKVNDSDLTTNYRTDLWDAQASLGNDHYEAIAEGGLNWSGTYKFPF